MAPPVQSDPPPGFAVEPSRTPPPSAGGAALAVPPPKSGRAPVAPPAVESRKSETYYEVKGSIFSALIEAIDLAQLARLDADSAREEIRDIVNEIIAIKNVVMSIAEQEELRLRAARAAAGARRYRRRHG
jgi:pilus assembly protein CpaF